MPKLPRVEHAGERAEDAADDRAAASTPRGDVDGSRCAHVGGSYRARRPVEHRYHGLLPSTNAVSLGGPTEPRHRGRGHGVDVPTTAPTSPRRGAAQGSRVSSRVPEGGDSMTIEWITPEQAEFFDTVVRFARTLPDDVRERDRDEVFSRESWDRCGEFGIQGLPAPGGVRRRRRGRGHHDARARGARLRVHRRRSRLLGQRAHVDERRSAVCTSGPTSRSSGGCPDCATDDSSAATRSRSRRPAPTSFSLTTSRHAGRGRLRAERTEDVHHERADRGPPAGVRAHHATASARTGSRRSCSRRDTDGLPGRQAARQDGTANLTDVRGRRSTSASFRARRCSGKPGQGGEIFTTLDAVGTRLHHGEPGRHDAPDDGAMHRLRAAAPPVRASRSGSSSRWPTRSPT